MNYSAALVYLDSFVDYEKENFFNYPEVFNLERMRLLVKEFGNPQNSFESVIIAGSKGKGSTAAFLSSILRMENWRVGLYTSPHLKDMRERIQVNGLWIGELRVAEFASRLKKIQEQYTWKKNPPTYFEVLTALAFYYFKEMKVQVAVLEVGLGGLYDSTNIAPAKVVGLTPVSLEHTDKLGKTVSKIAVQKCGVIKGREIVVSSAQVPAVQSVVEAASREREAELVTVGKDIRIFEREHAEDFQRLDVRTPWGNFYNLEICLRGRHQMENAAQAVGLAKALEKKTRLVLSESAVQQGLLDARWPGRLEKMEGRPKIVLDGAHNLDSIKRMLEGLKRHFKFSGLIVIFGSSNDKDTKGMLRELAGVAKNFIFTECRHPRAMPVRVLNENAPSEFKEISQEPSSSAALQKARQIAGSDDLILVTGSLFLVGEVRSLVLEGIPA
jgi:dihydrofolate synthase/folylpolyglutamate synthase